MTLVGAWINGLNVPAHLVAAIEAGLWHPPVEVGVFEEVFGERPECPEFYDVTSMTRQNELWQRAITAGTMWEPPEVPGSLGIDPGRTILIGSLGVDMPIALDYRLSDDNPRVLYLRYQEADKALIWVEVARDTRALLRRLGLEAPA